MSAGFVTLHLHRRKRRIGPCENGQGGPGRQRTWAGRLLGVATAIALCQSGMQAQAQAPAQATAPAQARVCVQDAHGRWLGGITISRGTEEDGTGTTTTTGSDGCAVVAVAASGFGRGVLSAMGEGFVAATVGEPEPGGRVRVTLEAVTVQQSVTVTADRGLVGVTDQAVSVVRLDQTAMQAEPGLTLDDRLHPVAGFTLYRRTSSWTANPTTEGVSLRGLGSTAASRTLVESDEVPLNDPFGGWIHWDEIPALALEDVVVERGGAANLYGSSAIGGVIAVEPVVPDGERVRVAADALGATENSGTADLLVTAGTRLGDVLAAGSGVDTAGYVPTAPVYRGLVDTQSSVAEESGRLEWRRGFAWGVGGAGGVADERRSPAGRTNNAATTLKAGTTTKRVSTFLRGNVLNETRGNGTPEQTNGTRLWRYLGGADGGGGEGQGALRVFGDRESYRQSFSAIAADRNSETLTKLQRVPTDELGFSLTGSRALRGAVTAGAGADLRDIRATDEESPVSGGVVKSTTSISAHQREVGGYAEGVWQPRQWTLAGSVRVDSFRTFDGRQTTTASTAVVREPEVDELVASPHLGVVRQLPGGLALTANAFRAFRGPTMNELYRTGQVGQQTTMANPSLLSERATGFEFGGELADMGIRGRTVGHLRASYFWTEVNRPVSTVLLAQTATTQTLQRQNLGQIRSRGLSLEGGTAAWQGLEVSAGYQLAVATVTRFNTSSPLQANLTGKWIPEVPRNMVTATVSFSRPRVGGFHLIESYTGRTYDDSANQFVLSGYARMDVSAERTLWRGLGLYAGSQNVLNRVIQAGRTPVLTLAAPRLVEGGLRWQMGR